jgi:hypothetical protein
MLVAGIVLVLAGLLVVVVSELTASGRLGMNSLAGLRFGAVMASDEGWTVGHRAARIPLDLAGAALAVAGLVFLLVPMSEGGASAVMLISAGFALVMVVIASVLAQRAATQVLYRIAAED